VVVSLWAMIRTVGIAVAKVRVGLAFMAGS
jgi:hypothetical protein